MRRTLVALSTVAVLTVTAGSATAAPSAGSEEKSLGPVTAKLDWTPAGEGAVTSTLTITRNGQQLLQGPFAVEECTAKGSPFCGPPDAISESGEQSSLQVLDLEADGEPEVLADTFSGGAHCCLFTYVNRFNGTGYDQSKLAWFNGGYTVEDLGDGGPLEILTTDQRFAYAFASYAGSGFPIKILNYSGGKTTDVTRKYPAAIKNDAKRWWKEYRRAHESPDARGLVAAWAADQYLLGRRSSALRTLRRLHRSGGLDGGKKRRPRGWVTRFDRRMKSWGYR